MCKGLRGRESARSQAIYPGYSPKEADLTRKRRPTLSRITPTHDQVVQPVHMRIWLKRTQEQLRRSEELEATTGKKPLLMGMTGTKENTCR